jgi:3,4-dihydroxy 2-butanone 4-phosphate synthase/GTP cyclohydrolase II
MPDLEEFARTHQLRILTIADLISYRLQTERLVRLVDETEITLDRTGTRFRAMVYQSTIDDRQILALVKGDVRTDEATLVRMHAGSVLGDVFSSTDREGRQNLMAAVELIEKEGRGVIVYLSPRESFQAELEMWRQLNSDSQATVAESRPHGGTLREYGLGAQVLRDLGLRKVRLLTNSPRKIAGIVGYGLSVESVPLKTKTAAG